MNFCEGEDAVFEQLMKTVPGFDREPEPGKIRRCKTCKHFDRRHKKCTEKVCPYSGSYAAVNS